MKNNLKVGKRFWCDRTHRYLWYVGKALNAKDFEFVDAGDALIVLNEGEVDLLK